METIQSVAIRSDDVDPRTALSEAAQVQSAMAGRSQQPIWFWPVMGLALGSLPASRALPEHLTWLGGVVNLVAVFVMVAAMTRTSIAAGRGGVQPRRWGGIAWLIIALVIIATLILVLLPSGFIPRTEEWRPVWAVIGTSLGVFYAGGGLLADRLRTRHVSRLQA